MERKAIDSSLIRSLAYNEPAKVLEIEFQPRKGQADGPVYQYRNFPHDLWTLFWNAPSKGQFFLQNIKNNAAYPYQKIEQEDVDGKQEKDGKKKEVGSESRQRKTPA